MTEMHPLDKLCTNCRVRIFDNTSNKMYTHPAMLQSLDDVSGVVLGLYAANEQKATLMSVELSDDPATVPIQLHLRFKDSMLLRSTARDVEGYSVDLTKFIQATSDALRKVYDGKFGMDRPRQIQPVTWEDLI